MRKSLFAVLSVLILSSCVFAEPLPDKLPPPGFPGYCTEVSATVISITQEKFPQAQLDLKVTESSDSRVLDLKGKPQTMTVKNHFEKEEGLVNFLDDRNIGAIAAYYLLQGDAIRAKLYPSADRKQWYIYGITRGGQDSKSKTAKSGNILEGPVLSLRVNKAECRPDETVTFTLTATNKTDRQMTLDFPTSQQFDFFIIRSGAEIWRWSDNKMFTQARTTKVLAPGESLKFEETWPLLDNLGEPVEIGECALTGMLTTVSTIPLTVGQITINIKPKP